MGFWDPALINALTNERPVIMFDLPGVGDSDGDLERVPEDCELRCASRPWTTVVLAGEKVGATKHSIDAHIFIEPDAPRVQRPAMVFVVANLQHSLELAPGSFVVELDGEP